MKKGQIYEGMIEHVKFPNKGVASVCHLMALDENGAHIRVEDAPEETDRATVKIQYPVSASALQSGKNGKGRQRDNCWRC